MSAELATVRETEWVFETSCYKREKCIRRVPVMERDGWLHGIVTLDDLPVLLAEEMGEMARLMVRMMDRERTIYK